MCTLEKYSLPIAMISPTQNISLYKTRLKYLQMYKKKYRGTTSSILKRYHVQTMYLQGLIVFSVTEFTCNHTLFFFTLKKELPLFSRVIASVYCSKPTYRSVSAITRQVPKVINYLMILCMTNTSRMIGGSVKGVNRRHVIYGSFQVLYKNTVFFRMIVDY